MLAALARMPLCELAIANAFFDNALPCFGSVGVTCLVFAGVWLGLPDRIIQSVRLPLDHGAIDGNLIQTRRRLGLGCLTRTNRQRLGRDETDLKRSGYHGRSHLPNVEL